MFGELRPAFEAVFSSDDELCVGEGEVSMGDVGLREFVVAGMVAGDAFKRGGKAEGAIADEVFGLFFVLFEVGAGG